MQQVNEVLITSFASGVLVSAISLEGGRAMVTLTEPDESGDAVVRAAWERSTPALADVLEVVSELSVVPVPRSSRVDTDLRSGWRWDRWFRPR